jgi:YVTN family beta-propeller protein
VASTLVLSNNSLVPGNFLPINGAAPEGIVYDWGNKNLYVSCYWSNSIAVISSSTGNVIGYIGNLSSPGELAYASSNGDIYAEVDYGMELDVISGTTNTVVATVTPPYPVYTSMAFDPVNKGLYLPLTGMGEVAILSTTTNTIGTEIQVGSQTYPGNAVWDSKNNKVFVTDEDGNLTVISGTTNAVLSNQDMGLMQSLPVYDASNGDVYIANTYAGNVTVVSATTYKPVANLVLGNQTYAIGVSPVTGDVYLVNVGNDTTTVISPSTNREIGVVTVGLAAWAITNATGNGYMYVVNELSDTITAIQDSSLTVTGTYPVGIAPTSMEYASGNGDLYVPLGGPDNVSIVSAATNHVIGSVNVGLFPNSVLAAAGEVFVSNMGSSNLSVIDESTNTLVKTIPVGYEPEGADYDPSNGYVYEANQGSNNLSIISAASNTVVGNVSVGPNPSAVVYDPANGDLYVLDSGNYNLSVVSTVTNKVVGNFSFPPQQPVNMILDPANGNLYLTDMDQYNVTVFSTMNNAVVGTVGVGYGPDGDILDSANGDLYVENAWSNNVTVISTVTNSVVANISVGYYPDGIAYSTSTSAVYVANYGSGSLSVFTSTPALDQITFHVSPARCGPITFNGSSDANGSIGYFSSGQYSTVAGSCSNYAFRQWNSTGGVTVQKNTSASTSVNVTGSGTLEAHYWLLLAVSLRTNATKILMGESVQLTPVVSGGDPPYSCMWNLNGTNSTSGACDAFNVTFPHAGTYAYRVWATDTALTSVESSTVTITVAPAPPVRYLVTFVVVPAGCGPVTFNGSTQANQSSGRFVADPYAASAPACAGYTFSSWSAVGDLSLSGTTTIAITVTVTGTGELSAAYRANAHPPAVHYSVSFIVQPATCGPITYNGSSAANGTEGIFLPNAYTASAPACAGYDFHDWTSSGGVSLSSSSTRNVTAKVSGNGTLGAIYEAAFTTPTLTGVAVSPSNQSLVPGAGVILSATPLCSGGPCPAGTRFSWSFHPALGTLNSNSGTIVRFTAGNTSGKVTLYVNATLNGVVKQSAPVTIVISSPSSTPASTVLLVWTIVAAVVIVAVVATTFLIRALSKRRATKPQAPPS